MLISKMQAWTLICSGALLLSTGLRANEAEAILKKVEAKMTETGDQVATMRMTLQDSDGKTKVRELTTQQKGTQLRLMRFSKPAEVKGVGFLVLSDDEMYLFMPEFGKVRRIASHVKNDTFMGTDFSYSDLGSSDYTDKFVSKLVKKEGKAAHLELLPKPGNDTQYGKLTMVVDLERYLPTQVRFYDKGGKLWKEMTSEKIEQVDGRWVPRKMTMIDHKKKHSTVMEILKIAFDTGLTDKDFSKRKLKRSR